ncbi:MAG TPA: hypothetical protein PLD73_01415 [Candidatus Hydrogenedentes bacterium]|nr:hypothetical protein [Candidatus Hydrogenedentota bacterium]
MIVAVLLMLVPEGGATVAYTVKILEKGSNLTAVSSKLVPNMFQSITAGDYTASNCSIYISSPLRIFVMTGNAAATGFTARYSTSTAYASGKKIYLYGKMRTTDANIDRISWVVGASTSGSAYGWTQANPVKNTWYDISTVYTTPAGWSGNLYHKFGLDESAGSNTKVMQTRYWVALDLTALFGAGNEPDASTMRAWVEWRMKDWIFQDWYGTADRFYRLENITNHGFTTGDMRNDTTADTTNIAGLGKWAPVYVINANWYMAGVASVSAILGVGDAVEPYYQTDRTDKVISKSLRLNLRSDADAEMTCDMLASSAWQPQLGMTVMVYDGTELVHTGKIKEINRSKYNSTYWKASIRVGTLSEVAYRAPAGWTSGIDYSTSGAAAEYVRTTGMSAYKLTANSAPWLGILQGRIEDGLSNIGEIDISGRNAADVLNQLAEGAGFIWYIDQYRKLHFRSPFQTAVVAAHALVDGNGYTDYKDVEYRQSVDQYRTHQVITGGYGDDGYRVRSVRSLTDLSITAPITSTTEACGNDYRSTIHNEVLWNTTDAQTAADAALKLYGSQVPSEITFDSGSTDWRPNTRLQVQLAALGIASSVYFNIDSVELYDMDGINVRARVTASQRDTTYYGMAPNEGPNTALASLQQAAANSALAVRQSTGTFTPTVQGSTGAGTYTYTTNTGWYIKHGSLVFFNLAIQINTVVSAGSGRLQIAGMPYDSENTQVYPVMSNGPGFGTSKTALFARHNDNTKILDLYGVQNNAGATDAPIKDLAAGEWIRISSMYQAQN